MAVVGIGSLESPMIVGIQFSCPTDSRKEFLQEWARKLQQETLFAQAIANLPNYVLLGVSLKPCGGRTSYRTVDDIPLEDVPCPCGDPDHWLIRFSDT